MKQKINLAVMMIVLGYAAAAAPAGQVSNTINSGRHEWSSITRMTTGSFISGLKANWRLRMAPGGSVTIEEKTPAVRRKLEINRADDGQLQRKYSVNGAFARAR